MSDHTPGPWEWWTSNSWRRLCHSDRGHTTPVLMPCVYKDGQVDIEASEADMALIEAAPELLAALKDTLNMLRAAHMSCGVHHDGNKRVIAARAALARATGEDR